MPQKQDNRLLDPRVIRGSAALKATMNHRAIAGIFNISASTVSKIQTCFNEAGISPQQAVKMSDDEIKAVFYNSLVQRSLNIITNLPHSSYTTSDEVLVPC